MMRRLLGWGIFSLFVLVLWPTAPMAAQVATAPYIQYLDAENGTFIIERADGTDSRNFGALTVPPTATSIVRAVHGPGWSPSGEWFAVISAYETADGSTTTSADVFNVDGSTRLNALVGQNVVTMAWSNEDLLLALVNTPNTADLTMVIVNPNTDDIVAQAPISADSTNADYEAFWARGFAITRFQGADGITTITTLNPNNGATNQFSYNQLLGISKVSGSHVIVLSPSSIGYVTIDGQATTFDTAITRPEAVAFHPTEDLALLTSFDGVWLISPTALTLVVPSGRFSSIPVDERRVWSSDGRSALVLVGDQILRFDLANLEAVPAPITSGGQGINISWAGDGLLGVRTVNEGPRSYYVVELATPRFNGLYETRNLLQPVRPAFSPNGQYLAQVDMGLTIFNLANRSRSTLSPDSRIFNRPSWSGRITWHPESFYFIAHTDITTVSYPRLVNVAENPYPRELPPCPHDADWESSLCVLWLPPQVNVGRLPIGTDRFVPTPIVIERGWWSTYAAWSPDGRQIAVGASPQSPDSPLSEVVDIYDLQTRQLIGRYPNFNPFTQMVAWDANGVAYIEQRPASIQSPPAQLALSPDGRIATQYTPAGVILVDAESGALIADLGAFPPPGYPRSVAFSPDGELFAFGSQIFNVGTGTVVARIPYQAQAVAFSPDGAQILTTVGWDVLIYNLDQLG